MFQNQFSMKRNILFLVFLLFTCTDVFSQHQQDTINIVCGYSCNTKEHNVYKPTWHPYAGIHISGDAEMFYIGPSFQAGVDYQLKKRIVLSGYLHYFTKRVNTIEYGGIFRNGKFKTFTGALLFQGNISKSLTKSFFLAAGIALQRWRDKYNSSYDSWDDKRTTLIPAFRLGYFFPMDQHKLTIELNGTGPYGYSYSNDISAGSVLEILTQISLGMRFIL